MTDNQRMVYGGYLRQLDEDGVYPDEDAEIGIVERSWRWADRNPDRAKKSAEQKGEPQENE